MVKPYYEDPINQSTTISIITAATNNMYVKTLSTHQCLCFNINVLILIYLNGATQFCFPNRSWFRSKYIKWIYLKDVAHINIHIHYVVSRSPEIESPYVHMYMYVCTYIILTKTGNYMRKKKNEIFWVNFLYVFEVN